MVNPILVALDTSDVDDAVSLAEKLVGEVGGFKVGLELIMSEGPRAVAQIAELGAPVFADAKLHDIPNTVEKAAHSLGRHGARWVTIHASGGADMISAAVSGLDNGNSDGHAGILAVSVLTSLDDDDLTAVGISRPLNDQVRELAKLAEKHGAEGIVCSPHEASIVRDTSADLLVVTPGIRLLAAAHHDQKRAATPTNAIRNGADLLVIGRPITGASDPMGVVRQIVASLS